LKKIATFKTRLAMSPTGAQKALTLNLAKEE
jgi:hypothetical protein